MKNKTTAGLLALFVGGIGIHKFYLGEGVQGFIYLILCWTFLPAIAAFIDAVILFTMSDAKFDAKYNGGRISAPQAQPQNIVVNVASTANGGGGVDVAGRLRSLHDLKIAGALSEEEFAVEKQKLLSAAN
jgi:TM2 domain-containing membrane protein YozV